ncbi:MULTISPECIES: class I SAM-dependent methyltransferase [Mycobacterium]|uniref:Methyltransferase n=5 Tax=Mycobacterium ulcerans group TaxID=2993898 RepID=B2HP59_MYCMM|nr:MULTISPECIES: class I SAM-dependent methyltransferase [Mycobacterium]ULL10865.1 class I SAM-dependent methyltransferase [Mycobacterium liflandii]ACC40663.1 methyltransferase [Mycobacterium marinum M]AGC62692.1 methyltransferase [Mycobacterium liflandii 128FXT]AXN49522.1 Ubiquinone/menaquinone biosynthesis C-methyltransferase UbiE [Mycobacterium marinum]EPQ48202.1 Methyltransferase [Mycobacterium sp. 012931]
MTIDTPIREDVSLAATHRAMWALGDYALMAEEVMAPLGPILVAAAGIGPGVRVLDVAAGSGNISLPAAKSGATVVSTDLTPELLQRSKARAAAQGLTLDYQEANAQALPFGDSEFDTVISAIGVMFAPDHQCSANELARVCKTGGTIGVISWTPEGFFGRMLATIRPYRPSLSAALPPSALWGREAYARGLFGNHVSDIQTQRGQLEVTRFQTAQAVHDYFKNHYGPTIEAYANIGDNAVLAAELDAQLVELADQYLTDGVMEWEYLVLTGTKK